LKAFALTDFSFFGVILCVAIENCKCVVSLMSTETVVGSSVCFFFSFFYFVLSTK